MEPKEISRRNFIRVSGLASAALCLGVYFPASAKEEVIVSKAAADARGIEMNAWLQIDTDGKVTITDHRAEMGQGSFQSVPQIVAEELEVDLKDVNVIFAQGNPKKYGSQITGGSSTIRGSYKQLLHLSATARTVLIMAAANKWAVPVSECYAESGNVIHKPSGKKFHYGELVVDASKLEAPKEIQLKKISEYKLIRKPLNRRDTPIKTNGEAIFGLDKRLPGMLYAVVERNPRMRGTLKSFDSTAALKVPGVKKVFKVQMKVYDTTRDGVVIVATSTWAAMQGRKALHVVWDDSGFEHVNTIDIVKRQEELLKTSEGISFKTQGDPDGVLKQSSNTIDVIYQTPYQAHSAMEPLNCIAHYQPDKIEVWGPIQAPDWIQGNLSDEFKIPKENVVVNMTFLGGGFGRKAFLDYPYEATLISKEIGAPVQVVWSREDDTTQGPFRPGIAYRCQGAIANGEISAIKFRVAGQNLDHWQGGKRDKPNSSTDEGFVKPYFNSIKNISFSDINFELPIPPMWWRSVYASTHGFGYESFMNEMAALAGKDQLDFRREYLKDERCQKLIDRMEEVSGWKSRKKNEGYGVAITECFNTTVGQIVKVSRHTDGKVKIDQVWAVMDCGWYVNPDIIRAQVEGSVLMALGAATIHEITFKDGLPEQRNFYNYLMPRMSDMPPVEVHIMENTADAGGVGEPGLPPFSPALTDAIYDLTGNRIRKLPFDMNKV
ncbi:xanthine dehydrogenase family protein molybdopterin-binding subunit [Mucilaginibacter agri]|uniref:Molybdopterin-dependent oxidoreductase n=1 Tax=Mucilaginibacter agri TaxID=2695265 RepID=A0A966DT81_9SPHI|nr:molybdopterin cofactor-binding domain-containing protein [Mucilaginibacter agri]NCD70973.1 molybdopterin-dependent oxidoreductase [Mucilaginibacter agri]